MLEHTLIPSECEHILIQEISESGDNEYYFSALGLPIGDFERSMRGRKRILNNIEKLEALIKEIKCTACHSIILEQIKSHTQAIEEIDNAWKPKTAK
jgi:hypothetical protein